MSRLRTDAQTHRRKCESRAVFCWGRIRNRKISESSEFVGSENCRNCLIHWRISSRWCAAVVGSRFFHHLASQAAPIGPHSLLLGEKMMLQKIVSHLTPYCRDMPLLIFKFDHTWNLILANVGNFFAHWILPGRSFGCLHWRKEAGWEVGKGECK